MENDAAATGGFMSGLLDGLIWFVTNIGLGFYNFFYALTHPGLWLDWSNKEAIMRFVYYGGSVEFFFVVFNLFALVFIIGVWRNEFLWAWVRGLEGFANTVGRFFAWAGLLMVLQQIIIVFMQRIFTRPDISFGFGIPLQFDISWFAEELKLYNAMVVCLCMAYTFVQGGHVRVDLVYQPGLLPHQETDRHVRRALLHGAHRRADLALWLVLPLAPPDRAEPLGHGYARPASEQVARLALERRDHRFQPQRVQRLLSLQDPALRLHRDGLPAGHGVLYRSYLEWKEGEESENKYLDRDTLGEGEEAYEGTH